MTLACHPVNCFTDGIAAALEAQAAAMANAVYPMEEPLDQEKFLNYAEENRVTFATGTLTDDALSWWNAYAQPIGIEQANRITWTELKRFLTNKYCPQTEVKKMEWTLFGPKIEFTNWCEKR
ncbi:hypothetical protein Tco_0950345 [Tanacetum coccineum]